MKVKKLSLQTLRRFIPYLTAYAKDIWLAVILGIINGIATVVMTLQIGQSIDQMIGEGQVRFNRLFHLLILFGGIVLINVVSQWLIQVLSNRLAYLSVAKLRKDAFAHLNRLPLRYYDQNSTEISSVDLQMIWTIFPLQFLRPSINYFLEWQSSFFRLFL